MVVVAVALCWMQPALAATMQMEFVLALAPAPSLQLLRMLLLVVPHCGSQCGPVGLDMEMVESPPSQVQRVAVALGVVGVVAFHGVKMMTMS